MNLKPLSRLLPGRREDGVALILTLGILSLLLVMALAFVTTALQSQTSAEFGESLVKARLLAETGLQKAYAQMSNDFSDADTASNMFPATKTGQSGHYGLTTAGTDWDGRYYWTTTSDDSEGIADAFTVAMGSVQFTPAATADILSAETGWMAIMDPLGSGAMIGRLAYLIVDESGKIDPSAVVSSTVDEGDEAGTRLGNDVTEIDLKAALTDDDVATDFQPSDNDGDMTAGGRWFSYYHIFQQNANADDSDASAAEVLQNIFPESYDIEAFFDGNTDRHRFNLAAANWDSFNNTISSSGIDSAAAEFWADDDVVATNNGGIPWLANCTDATRKNQIIANLIDYCDSDSIATTDDADAPTYVGLERVPYINEVAFDTIVTDDGDGTYSLVVGAQVELVNMYSSAVGDGAGLQLKISVTGSHLADPSEQTFSWTLSGDIAASSYQAVARSQVTFDLDTHHQSNNFGILTATAKLVDASGNLWDVSLLTETETVKVKTTTLYFMRAEVDDPRANLEATAWTWAAAWTLLPTATLGLTNSICNPNPGGAKDLETGATDPWNVSTAYIRNGPMTSLWELGAIHRGAAWETINLHAYTDASATAGLGAYANGDGNLLAQVKMDSDTITRGKVNINTYLANVLQGLFSGIPIGGTYASQTGTGTNLTAANVAAMSGSAAAATAGQILYENGAATGAGGSPFINRGCLAEASTLSDGSVLTQTTDAAREEVIGKMVGLTTVRQNFFTAIIVGQAIKDLPTGVFGGTFGEYDPGIDRILAEQKIMAVLYRDAFTNRFKVYRYEYWDD